MTYASKETSRYAGTPIELYEFTYLGTAYRYTSGDTSVTYDGRTYQPSPFTRSGRHQGDSAVESGALELEFPPDHVFAKLLMPGTGTTQPMGLTVRARHRNDAGNEFITVYIGQNASMVLTSESLQITFGSAQSRMSRRIPRLVVSRTCQHMLYDQYCSAVETSFQYTAAITAVAGRVLTISGLGTHSGTDVTRFIGGLIRRDNIVRGFIEAQNGDTVSLLQAADFSVGQTVVLSRGCDRQLSTCTSRFANSLHFGGHPLLPVKSPFEGRGLRVGTTI